MEAQNFARNSPTDCATRARVTRGGANPSRQTKTGDPPQADRRFSIERTSKPLIYYRLNDAINHLDIFIPPIDDPFDAPALEAAAGALAAPVSADALATAFL